MVEASVLVLCGITAFIVVCIIAWCCFTAAWKRQHIKLADSMSQIIDTSYGPVEVFVKGNAPYVLAFFGTPSTHDGPYGLFDEFVEMGFGIISPSRPGYGRTPVSSGKNYEDQPALYAAMLD